jgi:hypothetical protein
MRRQTLQKVAGGATNLHWREKLTSYSLANVGTHFLKVGAHTALVQIQASDPRPPQLLHHIV